MRYFSRCEEISAAATLGGPKVTYARIYAAAHRVFQARFFASISSASSFSAQAPLIARGANARASTAPDASS